MLLTWVVPHFTIPLFQYHMSKTSIDYWKKKEDSSHLPDAHMIAAVASAMTSRKCHCGFVRSCFFRSLPSTHKLCFGMTVAICLLLHQFPANRGSHISWDLVSMISVKESLHRRAIESNGLVAKNAKQIGQISKRIK